MAKLYLHDALLGVPSVDQRGGNGGTVAERGFEQSDLCKHAVSVEAITCHTCRFPQEVAGVGDMDDTGQGNHQPFSHSCRTFRLPKNGFYETCYEDHTMLVVILFTRRLFHPPSTVDLLQKNSW